jgi:hypothetical protein
MGMSTQGKSWEERVGDRSTATHGRRIALYVVFIVAFIGGCVWLVADPSGATDGPRGWGIALAPVAVLLFGWGLVRELRTGDTRDWRPIDGLRRGPGRK